jgi:hypothetical protein
LLKATRIGYYFSKTVPGGVLALEFNGKTLLGPTKEKGWTTLCYKITA